MRTSEALPLAKGPGSAQLAAAVLAGLRETPPRLPSRLLLDAEGLRLRDEIHSSNEYYVTSIERGIVTEHASRMMIAAEFPASIIGLGSTRASAHVVAAVAARQRLVRYYPVDPSAAVLRRAQLELEHALPTVPVHPLVDGLDTSFGWVKRLTSPKLVLLLGSCLGDFGLEESTALLRRIREVLSPGDNLLLGADMVKPIGPMLRAYGDDLHARFGRNALARLNREFDATFDPGAFRHVAEWNAKTSCMELFLEASCDMAVQIRSIDFGLQLHRGERILTGSRYKFTLPNLRSMLSSAGYDLTMSWSDRKRWYSITLACLL